MGLYKFENIKIGDKIIVDTRTGNPTIETVENVTKTQFRTEHGSFLKSNGKKVGSDGWYTVYAKLPGEGELEMIERANKRRRMVRLTLKALENHSEELSDDELETIFSITGKLLDKNSNG